MRVQFEITVEDLVDSSKRVLARSTAVSWKGQGMAYSALLGWLLAFVIITYLYGRPEIAAAIGLVLAALCAVLYPSSYEKAVEKRLRKLHLEELKGANTVLCEVELTTHGVQVKQMNRLVIYEWPGVAELQETADSIDLFSRDGCVVVVRDRAFATATDRNKFLELARTYLNSNRS
jgi:hypothetical protein